jgi:hypothetical protein
MSPTPATTQLMFSMPRQEYRPWAGLAVTGAGQFHLWPAFA